MIARTLEIFSLYFFNDLLELQWEMETSLSKVIWQRVSGETEYKGITVAGG